MEEKNVDIVIDFHPLEEGLSEKIKQEFEDMDIIESNGFSGTELVTVIISATVIALDKILNFYIKNRKSLKETSIKIGKNEVSLTGFSNKEIQEFIENNSIKKLRKQMKL